MRKLIAAIIVGILLVLGSAASPVQEFRRPLGKILDVEGKIRSGITSSSFEARGYRMHKSPNGSPVFVKAPEDTNWDGRFGLPVVDGEVYDAALDGSGNLYIAGWFTMAGGVSANNIAKWNGSS